MSHKFHKINVALFTDCKCSILIQHTTVTLCRTLFAAVDLLFRRSRLPCIATIVRIKVAGYFNVAFLAVLDIKGHISEMLAAIHANLLCK